jgi:hypothetical protein
MLMVPGILLVFFLLGYWNLDPFADDDFFLWFFGIPLVLVSIVWAVGIRWFLFYSMGRNTRKLLSEGSNRIMLGWRELELVNNRLVLTAELLQSSIDLRAIDKIVGNEDYTFVYIASVSAYIIPMNRSSEEEFREFVARLHEAWEDVLTAIPHDEDAPPAKSRDETGVKRAGSGEW